MRYVYMDNFRGFANTLLPVRQVTFLVGENSTGKSSFLKLLYTLSRPQFWFSPEYTIQEESDLGGFADIVSAWSTDKSYFKIGVLTTRRDNKRNLSCAFTVHTFENRDGVPHVSRYIQFVDGALTKFVFHRKSTKYKTLTLQKSFADIADVTDFFLNVIKKDRNDTEDFKSFPKNIPPNPPLPVAVSIIRSMEQGKPFSGADFTAEIPFSFDLTWIAPIRTKPHRFYDGTKKAYTPEGDHTPFVLRHTLTTKTKSVEFAEQLKSFGLASGLFNTIIPHSFDKSPQSPFEILIKFSGAELNINNVGYGVSQVLPLMVEFLSRDKKRTFAVQQPEVHLHPRAQAALGTLISQLAEDKGHSFILETHSDYLIDRCRYNLAKIKSQISAQVIFFQRDVKGNKATVLKLDSSGKYPADQPPEFRDFFLNEEMDLMEI